MSHHAVLELIPRVDLFAPKVLESVEQKLLQYDSLGIEEVRELLEEAHRRPIDEFNSKIVFVVAERLTVEAQQALLKLLEEPPVSTAFHFVLPTGTDLLPTLLSRFDVLDRSLDDSVVSPEFKVFLKRSAVERLSEIDGRLKAKDSLLLNQMQQDLTTYLNSNERPKEVSVLKELEFVARYLGRRGSSNKMLLEHLALSLPARS